MFKKQKLVEEHELEQVIEKQIRQYDPRIGSMAVLQKEMEDMLNRSDFAPEEKLGLFKSAQHWYVKKNRPGMDSSATVIVNPEAAQPQVRAEGEERNLANQMELHGDAQADEPGEDEL